MTRRLLKAIAGLILGSGALYGLIRWQQWAMDVNAPVWRIFISPVAFIFGALGVTLLVMTVWALIEWIIYGPKGAR